MFFFLSLLWFIRTTKVILFYLYLWQLKEYHIGRFLDHFRTEKGKRLLFNKILGLKIIFIFIFFVYPVFVFFALFFIYFLESAKGLLYFFQKKIKRPVLTKKTVPLILASLLVEILVLFALSIYTQSILSAALLLLVFDIFTPVIASAIALVFQPLAVLGRNQIIKEAKEKRAKLKDLLVIGITGSYGKTSTKEFLSTILSKKFKVLKTKKHQNSEVGISQCILDDLKPEHEIFICEMGAYNRGGIKLLCDITKPKIGILTGINEQHMATFGSQENIIKGKYELIESLPEEGLAIFNGDNSYCFALYQKTKKLKRFYSIQSSICGLSPDIRVYNIKIEKDFITFKVSSKDDSADFRINLLGIQNVLNILAITCCAKELGMSLSEISKACEEIEPWQSGMQLKRGISGLDIIDATYSANPDGVISHLDYLKIWPGKKIIVMPCLIELGKASKKVHKRIGRKIGEVCDLAIITTKERFKEIGEGAVGGGMSGENILFTEKPKEIFEKIKAFSQPGNVVLLESRVPNQLIKQLTINNESA